MIDSELWTCRGCGGQMIGKRPPDDRCGDCAQAIAGPFETEAGARAAAAHVIASPPRAWQAGSHRLLCEALTATGVESGAYDHRVITWLAGYEPQMCAAVAGLIARAHQAGRKAGEPR